MSETATGAAAEPAATSGATIELENLTKRYPGSPNPAVDNVTMEIKAGETVIFVGPSGCGKSTTLKMINRLIEPTSRPDQDRRRGRHRHRPGEAAPQDRVRDPVVRALPAHDGRRRTSPSYRRWSAGRSRRSRTGSRRCSTWSGSTRGEFHGRYPRQLSGGQQQRVGVARALAADPPVLLMDEPFGAVDPITRDHLQDELIRLQHELHKTIVFVTHDFDEAIKLGDRIAVLRERSHIAQFDTPEAILTNPADDFVSGFVGAGAALKRLNLTRVRDVEITDYPDGDRRRPAPGRSSTSCAPAGTTSCCCWTAANRPYKWLRRGDLMRAKGSLARAGQLVHDTVTRDATLHDALEAVLIDSGGRVAVTGRRGEYIGVVDMETLMNSVQELLEADRLDRHGAPARSGGAARPADRAGAGGRCRRGTGSRRDDQPIRPRSTQRPPEGEHERQGRSPFRDEGRAPTQEAAAPPPAGPRAPDHLAEAGASCRPSWRSSCSPPGCGSPTSDLDSIAENSLVGRQCASCAVAARRTDRDLHLLGADHRDPAGHRAHPAQAFRKARPAGHGVRQHRARPPRRSACWRCW